MNKQVKQAQIKKNNVCAARLALSESPEAMGPQIDFKRLIYTISAKIFSAAVKLKALALASSEVAQARLSEGVNSIFKNKIVILGLPESWMMTDELHGASL